MKTRTRARRRPWPEEEEGQLILTDPPPLDLHPIDLHLRLPEVRPLQPEERPLPPTPLRLLLKLDPAMSEPFSSRTRSRRLHFVLYHLSLWIITLSKPLSLLVSEEMERDRSWVHSMGRKTFLE